MGTSPSKVHILKCPQGYNADQFKKICTLFDKLDKDSNLGVSNDEIEDIAAHHVENCIKRMNGHIIAERCALEATKVQNATEETSQHCKIKREFETKQCEEERLHNVAVQTLQNKIVWYQSLNVEGKSNAFMKAVIPSGGEHMDFWSFFEYMKTRTTDIDNIKEK